MKTKIREIPGSITSPLGFRASGVYCDIKRLGTGKGSNKGKKRDLALIVSDAPAQAAGMFTTNQICAAPVKVCIEHLRQRAAQAIVVNSGNANACTGAQGLLDARSMSSHTAKALNIPATQVLVASTGRIGMPLPMRNVQSGIRDASSQLGNSIEHGDRVAEAILTSDTRPKQVAVEFTLGGRRARLGGICKGAGMIQPGMSANGRRPAASGQSLHATMLCFLTTDVDIQGEALARALRNSVALSFNRITVDGDMSTNDTVLILANGLSRTPKLSSSRSSVLSRDAAVFQTALDHVCLTLAQMIVRDGEGVTRFVTVRVEGGRTPAEADAAARAVANSSLVKTSWHGGDPNWGRIIDAIGYSAARVEEHRVDIGYSAPGSRKILWSLKKGQPTKATFRNLCTAVAPKEFDLHIRLNLGKAKALMYAADLTEAYVEFNKGDVSDPTSLGG